MNFYHSQWCISLTLVMCMSVFKILVEGQDLFVSPEGNQMLPIGHSAIFTCRAINKGNQDAYLKWYNTQSEEITDTTGRISVQVIDDVTSLLMIRNIADSDSGRYTCKGTILGVKHRASVSLQLFKDITFDYAPLLQNPVEYNDELIHCRVSGSPAPEVSWWYQGKELMTGGRYVVEWNSGLRIQSITNEDDGLYECRGEVSSMGLVNSRTISVVVSRNVTVPDMPKTVEVIDRYSTMVAIKVTAPDNDGGMPITAYEIEYEGRTYILYTSPTEESVVLTVERLSPSTTYDFSIRVKNDVGLSPPFQFSQRTMSARKPQSIFIISHPEGSNPHDYLILWKKALTGGNPIKEYSFVYRKVLYSEDGTIDELESENWVVLIREDDLNSPMSSYRLEGLSPGTQYQLDVAARNDFGWSEISNSFFFLTSKAF